MGTESTCRE